jgi:hypothetical protein
MLDVASCWIAELVQRGTTHIQDLTERTIQELAIVGSFGPADITNQLGMRRWVQIGGMPVRRLTIYALLISF